MPDGRLAMSRRVPAGDRGVRAHRRARRLGAAPCDRERRDLASGVVARGPGRDQCLSPSAGLPELRGSRATAVARVRLPPSCIELELTESVLQTGEATIESLRLLRSLGIAIALDDFGTGYSSLASLERLPLSRIKLDRTLIAGIDTNPRSAAIAMALILSVRGSRIEVTAEGVERATQFSCLAANPALYLQGFLHFTRRGGGRRAANRPYHASDHARFAPVHSGFPVQIRCGRRRAREQRGFTQSGGSSDKISTMGGMSVGRNGRLRGRAPCRYRDRRGPTPEQEKQSGRRAPARRGGRRKPEPSSSPASVPRARPTRWAGCAPSIP